jgi:hypothetical protein
MTTERDEPRLQPRITRCFGGSLRIAFTMLTTAFGPRLGHDLTGRRATIGSRGNAVFLLSPPGSDASRARALALDKLSRPLYKFGYKLADQSPVALTFVRSALFSGPLWLFQRTAATISMTFEETSEGKTQILIAGVAPRRVAQHFERLEI